ncbi:hypothetical protein RB614_33470 [Phytohabitans sp. ZYX-F-186]|uniref:YlbF family regulator n=1 Tax=Phytohabitans maris TaxID=3071409 RepID=A0ABU0ZR17_9ACTN|nr:hypothetical protein [Phytohabitans sp. ZYX-F-186]MDQ7909445.1 hypothetical protein [Phytohabitans sp. ZYX-F-186]
MTISIPEQVTTPAYREYVHYLRGKLVKAEAGLASMNDRYHRAKANFDRTQARRGITPETDVVNYIELKSMNPELKFWYSKVEHYQREVAAYGTALTALEAAHRMLGADDNWMDDEVPISPAT